MIAAAKSNIDDIIEYLYSLSSMTSVSYTHLDVYKRQLSLLAQQKQGFAGALEIRLIQCKVNELCLPAP